MKRRIGVLLPQSMSYPLMSKDFMNGLRLACPAEFEFKIEGIGLGENHKAQIDSIQKLVNQEEVELTTGIFGHRNLSEVLDFTESLEHPVIFSDFGAKIPLNLGKWKYAFSNSLDLYGATRALGAYFGQNDIQRIGISSCYYDIGYDFTYGMESVLKQFENVELSGHFITPHQPRENEAEYMKQFMEETRPDAIFGFYNGIFAQEHAEFLSANKVHNNIPMYLTPFSVDEKVLEKFNGLFHQTYCVSSWFPELNTKENIDFIERYQSQYGKVPSLFALLGYENGLLITSKLSNSTKVTVGPRGILTLNVDENRTEFAQFLWQFEAEMGKHIRKQLEKLPAPKLKSISDVDSISGWQNAYLCS